MIIKTRVLGDSVLVPFYGGAVVFATVNDYGLKLTLGSRPLLSRSGCI